MVKNTAGGNKAKGFARKNTNTKSEAKLRLSENENEKYAMVEKMNGNGMCDVLCIDGVIRLLHIRGKFRGRGKRDNVIDKSSWLLIGIRDYESVKEGKKQNCDLLEVYNDNEKSKLRNTITTINWSIFIAKENINNNNNNDNEFEDDGIKFMDEQEQEYMELIEKQHKEQSETITATQEDEKEIGLDDL
jgi:translation initiation factor 1A